MSEAQDRIQFALITGANGWLGKRLVGLFTAEGVRVRCLILPDENEASLLALEPSVEVIKGDLRNPSDCLRFVDGARGGHLVHTAGIIHPHRVRDFYSINVDGVNNLLKAAETAGVRRIVAVSSNSPIGCNPRPNHRFDETSSYHPYMNYGRSKMMMELAVKQAEARQNLETVIIRAPWFYGPGQPVRQTEFFSMIRQGKVPIVGSGNNLRSMAYIDNLCQGIALAAVSEKARGQVYWIADERPYSMNEVVDTVARLLDEEFARPTKHRRMRLPGIISELALLADRTIQSLGLYHTKIHVLSEMNKTIACSIERAQRELRYQPAVSLKEGMRRSISWCLERGIAI
jgi:nucleoside-diphosphate-sugar epimerase